MHFCPGLISEKRVPRSSEGQEKKARTKARTWDRINRAGRTDLPGQKKKNPAPRSSYRSEVLWDRIGRNLLASRSPGSDMSTKDFERGRDARALLTPPNRRRSPAFDQRRARIAQRRDIRLQQHGSRPDPTVAGSSNSIQPQTHPVSVHVRVSIHIPIAPDHHSRRLPTCEDQIAALLAKRHSRLYKNEARGKLYVTGRAPDDAIDDLREDNLTPVQFKSAANAKVGHTKDIERRRCEYKGCDRDQTHVWAWTYDVPRRYLAERLVHLEIARAGGRKVITKCPGCSVYHREFVSFASVGGFANVDRIVRKVLGWLGLSGVRR
ncbi:hypothetical protein DFH06DRAFT_1122665 [Mycena polygramma]|nr:hypothetical protein DFH06DRAFT_1122665 [Mycena polygramma]